MRRYPASSPTSCELLAAGLGPAEAILEGEVVAYDAAAGELRPFGEVMLRRRKHGIDQAVRDVPVGLFCFELLYADGQDLTMLPYPQRRAALEAALTLSPRLRLTTAAEVTDPAALDAMFAQAVTDGCEGLVCKSTGPDSAYQAGARGWQWIKLKRDYRTELSDTADLVVIGAFAGRGRRTGVYGAVLLAAYDADADVFRAVTKCGAGFSDADLAALPARLAPLLSPHKPARVDARQEPDVWFEPGLVLEILSAELTLSPNYTAAWGQIQDDAGLAMRFPRFTGRWRDDKAAGRRHHHPRAGRAVPHRPAHTHRRVAPGRQPVPRVARRPWLRSGRGLEDAPAAVHGQRRAGDVGGVRGGEEGDGGGDLGRRAESLGRGLLDTALPVFLARPVPGAGEDRARKDGVDPDRGPVLDRELAGQCGQAALGRRVSGVARQPDQRVHRRRDHHRAVALDEVGEAGPDTEEGAR